MRFRKRLRKQMRNNVTLFFKFQVIPAVGRHDPLVISCKKRFGILHDNHPMLQTSKHCSCVPAARTSKQCIYSCRRSLLRYPSTLVFMAQRIPSFLPDASYKGMQKRNIPCVVLCLSTLFICASQSTMCL
jgi:hypothetical protein